MAEEILFIFDQYNKKILIKIERKKMTTCRLKVFPDQKVKFSVPLQTTSEWIVQYLENKKDWIFNKLDFFKKTKGYAATNTIQNGMSIQMLGQDMIFDVYEAGQPEVHTEYRTIHLGVPVFSSQETIIKIFEKWWRKNAYNTYAELLEVFYPIIEKHDIKKPNLLIRKMQTLWGSSSPRRNTITLNFYLLKARKPCIEYVVLHELTHFLYPNHSKNFYDFLTLYMPDWKDRKKILDNDVVRGL
ncbi:hydrolase [Spirochaetia bacterium]|nr:hydrolase [Spirochaetia bacterium]